GGGGKQQLRLLVRNPSLRRYPAQRGVGFSRRFHGQAGGQQRRAAISGEVGVGGAERVVAAACFVEVGKRFRKVATAQRYQPEVVPGHGVIELLPGGRKQLLGVDEVCGRPA